MEYLTAIIVGILSLLGVVISSAMTSNKTTAIMQAKIESTNELTVQKIDASNSLIDQRLGEVQKDIGVLSERVDKHNNLVERMAKVESSVSSAHKRLDDAGVGRAK